jgi:uncharacterized protein (DUF924 family)
MTALPTLLDDDPHGILAFWFDEVGQKGWYNGGDALAATIRERYLTLWELARSGACDTWRAAARPCLALVILLDQFPRNMFRGDGRAFSSDAKALGIAKGAISRGQDKQVGPPGRDFFYLPLAHSESLADQERSVARAVMAGGTAEDLPHPRAHRAVIRRFGRFPYRNAALGRTSTPAEEAFLAAGGYAAALAEVKG